MDKVKVEKERKCCICLKKKDNLRIVEREYVCEDCIEAQREE